MMLLFLFSLSLPLSLYSLSIHAPKVFTMILENPSALLDDFSLLSILSVGLAGGFTIASLMLGIGGGGGSKKKSKKLPFDSTLTYPHLSYPLDAIASASTEKDKFLASFPYLKSQLLSVMRSEGMPEDAVKWVDVMTTKNVLGGKLQRGTAVLSVQRTLKAKHLGKPVKEVRLTPLETGEGRAGGAKDGRNVATTVYCIVP